MSRPDDAERLRHMRDASREALDFVRGRRLDQLSGDRMLALALVKCIEIVGEAASNVSQPTRARFPGIPWADAIAMRNRLIHGYHDVDEVRVWNTVTQDLVALLPLVEDAIAHDP